MSLTVFLDTGPLGILTNPRRPLPELRPRRGEVVIGEEGEGMAAEEHADEDALGLESLLQEPFPEGGLVLGDVDDGGLAVFEERGGDGDGVFGGGGDDGAALAVDCAGAGEPEIPLAECAAG
jgi:hypothetical protein